jgi:hypothetical protein
MKGKLNKTEEGWVVVYDQRTLQDPAAEDGVIKLHPADAKTCDNYGDYSVDWIGKEVEFVIENYNYGGTYAKITEQMIDKDLVNLKKNLERLDYWKLGYNTAKQNLYTPEEMIEWTMAMIAQYAIGNTNIWNRELLKESLPKNKNHDNNQRR